MSGGIEEKVVPQLLRRHGVRSVLVVGAGTGRQYEFLALLGVPVRGSYTTLAPAARERHPGIDTTVDDLLGADERHSPVDACPGDGRAPACGAGPGRRCRTGDEGAWRNG